MSNNILVKLLDGLSLYMTDIEFLIIENTLKIVGIDATTYIPMRSVQYFTNENSEELYKGQYTGQTDVKGNKIYEGAYLEWHFDGKQGKQKVIFEEGMFGLKLKEFGNVMIKLNALDQVKIYEE